MTFRILLLVALICVNSFARAQPAQILIPTDVSAYARGVDAASFDPAALTHAKGLELQIRSRHHHGISQLGAFATVPLWDLAFAVGFEGAFNAPVSPSRMSYLLSFRLLPNLGLGLAYRQHRFDNLLTQRRRQGEWDIGVQGEPTRWLSWSLGIDAFNEARLQLSPRADDDLIRVLRVGAAVRPWAGSPWLTLGADTRIAGTWNSPRALRSRAVIDVAPFEGWHLLSSYEYAQGAHSVGLGVSIALNYLESLLAH